jgi:hypothetical protein
MLSTFIILGIVAAFVLRHLKGKTDRKAASFKLYAVRDELVCLVAEKKLSAESEVFQYYYNSLNIVLKKAPNVGLDDAMDMFLRKNSSEEVETTLKAANLEAEKMLQLVKHESPEVSIVIADYYAALKYMILSHSSFLRFFYIVLLKYNLLSIFGKLKEYIPRYNRRVLKALDFVIDEEERFRHVKC